MTDHRHRQAAFEPDGSPIGWDGQTLAEMLADSEACSSETGHYQGLDATAR